jgi:hypothetical protein
VVIAHHGASQGQNRAWENGGAAVQPALSGPNAGGQLAMNRLSALEKGHKVGHELNRWAATQVIGLHRGYGIAGAAMATMLDKAPVTDLFGVRVAPEPPLTRRSRITNDPTGARCNRSTAAGRRLADLLRGFLAEMGNPTSIVAQSAALQAAELTVAAEDARARLLAGQGDADQVVRLQNLAQRAVRKLGIDQQPTGKRKKSFADYVRQKAAGQAVPAKVGAA